jgi:hypothetical protein
MLETVLIDRVSLSLYATLKSQSGCRTHNLPKGKPNHFFGVKNRPLLYGVSFFAKAVVHTQKTLVQLSTPSSNRDNAKAYTPLTPLIFDT